MNYFSLHTVKSMLLKVFSFFFLLTYARGMCFSPLSLTLSYDSPNCNLAFVDWYPLVDVFKSPWLEVLLKWGVSLQSWVISQQLNNQFKLRCFHADTYYWSLLVLLKSIGRDLQAHRFWIKSLQGLHLNFMHSRVQLLYICYRVMLKAVLIRAW